MLVTEKVVLLWSDDHLKCHLGVIFQRDHQTVERGRQKHLEQFDPSCLQKGNLMMHWVRESPMHSTREMCFYGMRDARIVSIDVLIGDA